MDGLVDDDWTSVGGVGTPFQAILKVLITSAPLETRPQVSVSALTGMWMSSLWNWGAGANAMEETWVTAMRMGMALMT